MQIEGAVGMSGEATQDVLAPAERAVLDAYEAEIRELYAPVRDALAAVEPAVEAASERCSRALEAWSPAGRHPNLAVARATAAQVASS